MVINSVQLDISIVQFVAEAVLFIFELMILDHSFQLNIQSPLK